MEIRLARIEEVDKVINFYKIVCNDPNNKARWHYGIYPTDEDLINDINNKELYILLQDNEIVSAAVIRMQEDELYLGANFTNHNPVVIHILTTSPSHRHHGYARELLCYLIDVAKNSNRESIHLDIVYDNDYEEKLYKSVGFVHVENKELYYPDTGIILSSLFELILK